VEADVFKHILVPFDFSTASERALEVAIDVAKIYGASLTILYVHEVPAHAYAGVDSTPAYVHTPISEAGEERLNQIVRDTQARFPGAQGLFKVGFPSDLILAVAADGYDLIAMGTHGRRGIARAALGSVAEKVVRMSTVPVLTVYASEG
jgi:nucleotide-binding universal stress UspA family protein